MTPHCIHVHCQLLPSYGSLFMFFTVQTPSLSLPRLVHKHVRFLFLWALCSVPGLVLYFTLLRPLGSFFPFPFNAIMVLFCCDCDLLEYYDVTFIINYEHIFIFDIFVSYKIFILYLL